MTLFLLEPDQPGAAWQPFAGVRPLAELRAGAWLVRERWEAALRMDTAAILGGPAEGFVELDAPETRPRGPVEGPAVVARSDFAPSGRVAEVEPGVRRLEHEGTTVAWIIPRGETWSEPDHDGSARPVEGLLLGGTWDLVTALERFLVADCADFLVSAERDPLPAGTIVLGDPGHVVLRGAVVEPGVVFDVRGGAVVLEAGVEVRHGTRLEGPVFAGPGTRILGGFIRASAFGPSCVVRGEIAASVFLGYANKAHDGFVGHSVLGHWVNLGAGTTTSNLKNTYGEIRLDAAGTSLPTGRTNLGSLLGDHAKTAIGTMLSTGTIVGAGASVFGSTIPPRYISPMAWGTAGEMMEEEGFLRIAGRVMPRRKVEFTEARRESLRLTWRRLVKR